MDFVADQLVSGARFRALTVVDVFTKECLAIEVGRSLKGEHDVAVLKRIASSRGAPKTIFCDNGSEFVGRALDLWAYVNKVRIDFSRPGKPTDNAHVESFNGRLRAFRQRAPITSRRSPCWSARAVHSSSMWGGISLLSCSLELFLFQRK
jgi:transposase InsO family protein